MKLTTYIRLLLLSCLLLLQNFVQGQETGMRKVRSLTLNEAIAEALENNWEVRKMNQQIGMVQADLKKANSIFLPTVTFSETFITTTDPMLAFGTKLGQSAIAAADFDPAALNNPERVSNFNTKIELAQPIINLKGIYSRKAAQSAYDASFYNKQWIEEMLVLKTKSIYFNLLLAQRGQLVVQRSLEAASNHYKIAKDQYEQGLISLADLMGAELRVIELENSVLNADHQVANLNQTFLQLIGTQDEVVLVPLDSLSDEVIISTILTAMEVPDSRADMLSLKSNAEMTKRNLNSKKGSFIPSINAFGSYGFNDSQIFGTQANNYLMGIQMKWDLFKGDKQIGAIQRARFENNYAELVYQEKFLLAKRAVSKLKHDLERSVKQLELAQLSKKQAKELYKIRLDRYQEGLEKTSDLLLAEANFLNKEFDLLESLNQHMQLVFRLEAELSVQLISIN